MDGTSWITELRQRLDTPPPRPLATQGKRYAALVAVYVENGQLWVLLSRSASPQGGAVFPATDLDKEEEVWSGLRKAAEILQIDSERIMPLGELDHVAAPTGEVLVPYVAVVPPPETGGDATRDRAPLPLIAARNPSLVEERSVKVGDEDIWVRIAHMGPITLAGAGVDILDNLLERVFHV